MTRKRDTHVLHTVRLLVEKGSQADKLCSCRKCIWVKSVFDSIDSGERLFESPPERVLYRIFSSYERINAENRKMQWLKLLPAGLAVCIFLVSFGIYFNRPQPVLFSGEDISAVPAVMQINDVIETGNMNKTLFFGDEVRIDCIPDTRIEVADIRKKGNLIRYSFKLKSGTIKAAFHAGKHSFSYEFIMPDSTLRSTGTEFTIELVNNSSRIHVNEGKVSLLHHSSKSTIIASAGNTYLSSEAGFLREDELNRENSSLNSAKQDAVETGIKSTEKTEKKVSPDDAAEKDINGKKDRTVKDVKSSSTVNSPDIEGVDENERRLRSVEERALRRR